MSTLTTAVGIMALLGSAISGGVFFAFFSFVMGALAPVPPSQGIGAMQSSNVVVLNRSFLGIFMGTALLSIAVIVLSLLSPVKTSTVFMIAAALLYLVGTLCRRDT